MRSGREARNAAFSAAVSVFPGFMRDTLGVGFANVPGFGLPPGRSESRLTGGFMTASSNGNRVVRDSQILALRASAG